jgi:hypothetical protein
MPSWCRKAIVLLLLNVCGVTSLMIPRNVNPQRIQSQTQVNNVNGVNGVNVGGKAVVRSRNSMTASESASSSSSSSAVVNDPSDEPASTSTSTSTLPVLFPAMAQALARLGYSTPTPIQAASAAESNQNLLLIAPTGSGKTLAYLLPAFSNAIHESSTGSTGKPKSSNVLVVAPTRELAVQLQRDAVSLLDNNAATVALAVRGVPFTMSPQAKVLVGTPAELLEVLQHPNYAQFLSHLSGVVLDEVDVLLPLASKNSRTSLDSSGRRDSSKNNAAENERRKQQEEKQRLAHKKKMLATKRAGAELTSDNKQVVVPTELLLKLIAMSSVRDPTTPNLQVLAGSATASRRTLDRLNRAMRAASAAANTDFEMIWSSDVQVCRPPGPVVVTDNDSDKNDNDGGDDNETTSTENMAATAAVPHQHTIRAVTVPSQVHHRYISLSKEAMLSSDAALAAVAKIATSMKPQRALVFLCGEFAKQPAAQMKKEVPVKSTRGRQNSKSKVFARKAAPKDPFSMTTMLSARKTCDILGTYGIQAKVSSVETSVCVIRWVFCAAQSCGVVAHCRVMFSLLCRFLLFDFFVKH